MREMKDSGIEWIGKIPEEWTKDKVIRLFNIIGSGTTPKNITSDFPCVNWIQSGDINGSLISSCKNNVSESIISQYSALKIYAAPFIVIAMYGASVGNTSISLIDGCVNQACCVLSASIYNLNYAFYAIKSSQNYLIRKAIGGGQPNISQDTIKQLWLPLPALHEQKRIAAFLDAECAEIDTVLEKTRASIEEYKKLKQAVITQAVTKGIRGDRPMKDSGIEWIGEIPAEWNKDKVIRVFSVIGSGTTPKSSDENLFDGNTPWIQSSDINGENLFVTKNCVSNSAIESYSALRVYQAPYLVVAMYGASVGNLSLSMIDACVNQACCALKKPTINLKFSFYIFKAVKDYLARKAVGGGQPNISQETIKQLWLPIPSADEQIEISNYLDEKCRSVDALIAKKQQYLTEIENYKKSLIYEYVTGKKEVV